jgi:hypothetical protein
MKLRLPWRRRVLATRNEPLLVNDTSVLAGDELVEVAPGRYVRVADLMAGNDVIETVGVDALDREGST